MIKLQDKHKGYIKRFIQLSITIILFVILFRKIDINNLLNLIKQINFTNLVFIWMISISFVIFPALRTFTGFRYLINDKLSLWEAYQYFLVGMFYNNILPSSIGGDVARIYLLYKKSQAIYKASSIVIFERLVGSVATITISLMGALFIFHLEGLGIFLYYIIIVASVIGVIFFILFNPYLISRIVRFNKVKQFLQAIQEFKKSQLLILKIFFFSLCYQLADIFVAFLFSRLIKIDISFVYFLVFIPLVYIITMLPITINGLGLRENLLVVLLGLVAVAPSSAVLLSLLIYLDRVTRGLVGGLFILWYSLTGEVKIGKAAPGA